MQPLHTDTHAKNIFGEIFGKVTICNGCEDCPVLSPAFNPTSLALTPSPKSYVVRWDLQSCLLLFRGGAQGLSGQCWVGNISSADSHWKRIGVTEEYEVGPASALIWERFQNYFMPVSSTDFDNVEERS